MTRSRPALALALVSSLAPAPADAATLTSDTTWAPTDSPVVVAETTTVAAGTTLTVLPGVEVRLAEGVDLVIAGALVARGTEDAPIIFTAIDPGAAGDDPARWRSVVFEDSADDAVFEGLDHYIEGSILEHCRFEYAERAVRLQAASPFVHASDFYDNSAPCPSGLEGGAAIMAEAGSAPRIVACHFERNVAEGFCQGGAIHADRAAPIIQDNTFIENASLYGGAVTTVNVLSPIVGNTFLDNDAITEGGAVALVSSSPAFLDNVLIGNTTLGDGAGLHVCVTCYPHANPFVMDNTITGNINEDHGAAGLGAAYLRVMSHNNIYDNVDVDGAPSDFAWMNTLLDTYAPWVTTPDISRNWWGTTELAAIEETIFDGQDDPEHGTVAWEPALDGPIEAASPRVTITTTKITYAIGGEPMSVVLTLYNPGAERSVDLAVWLQYDGGPPLEYLGPVDFPGATRAASGVRLDLPEGGLWFGELRAPAYPGGRTMTGRWSAAMFDADTGERVGDVCAIRFELAAEEVE